MRRYKNILLVAVAALTLVPSVLFAQTYGSINTFSPYSMYGLGELTTPGTTATRAMGGMGVAMRTYTDINLLNPASYSAALSRSVLFSYSMEGYNMYNKQNQNGSNVYNSYAGVNIHDIAIQMPLAKNLGMGFSVTPYSSTGYDIATTENITDIGLLSYIYSGSGDVTQVKLGVGWMPFKNFSIGAAAQYFWGSLDRTFTLYPYVVTGNGTYYSAVGITSYDVSRIRGQVGFQWSPISTAKNNLTIGAAYDLGGNLNPDYSHTVYGDASLLVFTASEEEESLSLILPNQINAGVTYQNLQWVVGVDYTYQNWLAKNSTLVEYTSSGVAIAYNDFGTVKFGVQWTPNRNDVRSYIKRVSYRGGVRYGGYQNTFGGEEIEQFAATLGASFPIKTNGISKIDFGMEYGSLGSSDLFIDADSKVGLIGQKYFKVSLGFSLFGEDYWFQRPKFD
ncbi:MAG: hypothetical protein SNG38_00635 [Rikenellaceae bacterium]